ncbi:MAG: caspase family protein [Elusimicrobiota bacterium]
MKHITLGILLIALIQSCVYAGRPTAEFLLIGQGARAEALGRSVAANAFDYTAAYWNPAGICFLEHPSLGFYSSQLPAGISSNYAGLILPFGNTAIGFDFLLNTTSIEYYDRDGIKHDESIGDNKINYNVSFAVKLKKAFSLGCSIGETGMSYKGVSLDNDLEANGIHANLGALYNNEKISLGIAVSHLGQKLKFRDNGPNESQPSLMRFGMSWYTDRNKAILLLGSYEHVFDDPYAGGMRLGCELSVLNSIMLRAGSRLYTNYKKIVPSFGIGTKSSSIVLDYAYTMSPEGIGDMDAHSVGLSFIFGRRMKKAVYVGETSPPAIVVKYLKQGEKTLTPGNQTVYLNQINIAGTVLSDANTLLTDCIIKNNGEIIFAKHNINDQTYDINTEIALTEGINNIRIEAVDSKGGKTIYDNIVLIYKKVLTKGLSMDDFVNFVSGKGKNWAVLIGVDEYPEKSGFQSLGYVANDLKAIKNSLIDNVKEFNDDTIFVFGTPGIVSTNSPNYMGEPTKANIEEFLGDKLPGKVEENDRVLIFYSGHGLMRETRKDSTRQGFLVPIDGEKDKPVSTCISMDLIQQFSESLPAKQVLFVVDTCNSGLVLMRNKGDNEKKGIKELITSFSQESRQAMTAGQSLQYSQISSKFEQSVYTHYFIDGLKGHADADKDGVLSINELHTYVQKMVTIETDHKQVPQMGRLKDGGEGDFFFILK